MCKFRIEKIKKWCILPKKKKTCEKAGKEVCTTMQKLIQFTDVSVAETMENIQENAMLQKNLSEIETMP